MAGTEGQDLSGLKIDKQAVSARRARKGRRTSFFIILAAVALLAALYFLGIFTKSYTVQPGSVTLMYPSQALTVLSASGYVVAERKAAVSSKITGKLESLMVEEGSRVKKGEVIARLDDADLLAAKAQAEATLNAARFDLDQTKASLYDAEKNYSRNRQLIQKALISRADYDTSFANYEKAKAAVAAAKATVLAARAALQSADVSLGYTYIRAPFDAVVLTKNADIGDIITPLGATSNVQAAVVTIADLDSLQVEADVSESGIEKVWEGEPAVIELDALPGVRFPGRVHMIVPTADRSKATVTVKVQFLRKDRRILPEMSARVDFLSRPVSPAEETPRTVINPGALARRGGKTVVFVIEGGRAFLTPVVAGPKLGDMITVRSGLAPGETVVVGPPEGLKNGSKVKTKTAA
ncbi:MAG: efflux RND transporter periplasmic adaptor subunit [Nitrospiraceae bacterium]|nr:efflux RND transporter periplasmic adaptor subunit [Nitrospiraceae bacterium]